MDVVSLFTGIGGIELGLKNAGLNTRLMCEIDPSAQKVLRHHFPDIDLRGDVTTLKSLPKCDLLTAGFPCQDLSQAGRKNGMSGTESNLASNIFRLVGTAKKKPEWLLMENVPYMLRLHQGKFMHHLIEQIESVGYRWAYRVVDARSFGLPQRRPRILILASLNHDPAQVLFPDENTDKFIEERPSDIASKSVYGFYWTEGSRGLGWAKDAVPPIKGGSGLGIPSAPAIWNPRKNSFGTIDIRDAERLQGFPSGWTEIEESSVKGARWKQVGNAVCVKMSEWLGENLVSQKSSKIKSTPKEKASWSTAGQGEKGKIFEINAGPRVSDTPLHKISDFLEHDVKNLSVRASKGFLSRAQKCTNISYSPVFLNSLERYIVTQE